MTEEDLRYATTLTTASGFPVINYDAVYPAGHRLAGQPVLKMLDGTEIVNSDLTAIVAGSAANGGGGFPINAFPVNPNIYPRRQEPFREIVVHYHDETGAVQAFPEFYDEELGHTLHSVRDAFAINYGSAGTGAEVLANRLGVGPMWKCPECKFEEFFLSSWAVGDPAMVVDVPANAPCSASHGGDPSEDNKNPGVFAQANALRGGQDCTPTAGRKATRAFYPDDPSNVYHSYLRDHVKFRVLHAGSKEHHIHHLHAHQRRLVSQEWIEVE